MTNAELIAKIKAKIERKRQAIRVLNEHTAPEQMSKTCAIFQYSDSILSELLSFLSTLEEPVCDELEAEIQNMLEQYAKFTDGRLVMLKPSGVEKIARHFAKWGAEHSGSSEIPNDLEEAAKEYVKDIPTFKDSCLMKAAFEDGWLSCKEQMMEEAVEGEVIIPIYEGKDVWSAEIKIPGRYEPGDKVRIIIVKEDGK